MENEGNIPPKDTWTSGEAYEPYVGRWSRLVAHKFLQWLSLPTGMIWLDVGCGTGALTQTILQFLAPKAVNGVDAAEGYIAFALQKIINPRATFYVGNAQRLPVETAAYDAVVSGLVLNFAQDPDEMVAEMVRVTKSGGIVAVYVWDYAEKMEFMRYFWDAAAVMNPAGENLDEGRRFPLCNPGPLEGLFQAAGLSRVEVQPIDILTYFKNFDDYWSPFLGGQGPAPSYLKTLREADRRLLRERVRASLPIGPDGSIPLMARAWAVRGIR